MNELLVQIEDWLIKGIPVALATVIKTWGSSPRPAGAWMAVTSDHRIAGSVSGGCVEGAVIDTALAVLQTGKPAQLHFGVADDEAWEVGLACGGEIDVLVRIFGMDQLNIWKKALEKDQVFCSGLMITREHPLLGQEILIMEDGTWLGKQFPPAIHEQVIKTGIEIIKAGCSGSKLLGENKKEELFFQLVQPKPTLILVGGVHIAVPLVKLAKIVGFEVIVIDPRRLFSSQDRFPDLKQLLPEWPETAFKKIQVTRSTAIVMLTHDPKIDDPALKIALETPAFYIGALGSQKTHQKRIERLIESGVDKNKLAVIHAPVGLDIGGSSPEEIALSVIAEVVQTWNSNT